MNKEIFFGNTLAKNRRNVHMANKSNRKWKIFGLGVVFLVFSILILVKEEEERKADLQKGIAKEIIRFHIIANSDTEEDQTLKLEMKEQVVTYLQEALAEADDIEEARKIMNVQLLQIEQDTNKAMAKKGFSYEAKATLTYCDFPVKKYGDMVFPAGKYEALRIEIGQAKGKNWWCVMFPSLCFVEGTYGIVPEESKEELEGVLTEEEYETLTLQEEKRPVIKWKVVEMWKSWWS